MLARAPIKTVPCVKNEFSSLGYTTLQMKVLWTLNDEEDPNWRGFTKRLKLGKTCAAAMKNLLETYGLVIKNPNPLNALIKNLTFTDKLHNLNPKIQKTVIDPEKTIEAKIEVLI